MIHSANEFAQLRTSEVPSEQSRASSDEAPEQVWFEIIRLFPDLREWVAHNKTVPLSVLDILSADENVKVRYVVASKRKLNEKLRTFLANDKDSSVRQRIALHPKCELHLLELLAKDSETFVRESAQVELSHRAGVL